MGSIVSRITNLGVTEFQSTLDQRRIRLINSFSLIAAILMVIFGTFNLLLGAYDHGALIFSGFILVVIPPLILNKACQYSFARNYFISISILFINFIAFRSVLIHHNRYNEVFMVGFSALIIIVCDNPMRTIYFVLTTLSTIGMITARKWIDDLAIDNDTIMAYINTIVSFASVYFFTSIFKNDLINSANQLKLYSDELEKHELKIIRQRDELFANRQLLRATIDSLPVFIGLIDMEGKYLVANSLYEQTFNIPVDEIEGKNFKDILPDNILKTHTPLISKGLKGKSPTFSEVTEFPDGKVIHSIGKYIPIFDAHNKQFALAVYVVDNTRQKNTEGKLRALNQTKNRLLSVISHDVKSPLNSLRGLLTINESMSPSEIKDYNNKIAKQLDSVTFNIDNLLNWAKSQMDGFNISPEKIDIESLVESCIEIFHVDIKRKNIILTRNHVEDSIAIVDKEALNLVVRNLMSNAIKFTPTNGTIEVITSQSTDEVIIDIIDSGKGIPFEKIKELKEGASSLTSESGTDGELGTGLGLSLSIHLVKLNGGKLLLNKNSRLGTTARIILPKNI